MGSETGLGNGHDTAEGSDWLRNPYGNKLLPPFDVAGFVPTHGFVTLPGGQIVCYQLADAAVYEVVHDPNLLTPRGLFLPEEAHWIGRRAA